MAGRLEMIRIAAAEFIGTAFLVCFGCACCTQALSAETWTIFHAAIGFGLIIAIIVMVYTLHQFFCNQFLTAVNFVTGHRTH